MKWDTAVTIGAVGTAALVFYLWADILLCFGYG